MSTNTYTALLTQTLSTAAASITFNSIPQGYTDLVIIANMQGSGAAFNNMLYPVIQFNGDTGANYSYTSLFARNTGSSDTVVSERSSNASGIKTLANTSVIFSPNIIHIQNYSNTTTFKTVLNRGAGANGTTAVDGTLANVGLWRNTAAISSITITVSGGSFNIVAGSTFTLYGIAAEGAAYATGGMVTSDSTYYYHTFLASGAFVPKKALTCDYLVVAGGGGGASGGGGAGGLLGFTAQALTSGTSYTATVGAGGASGTGNTSGAAATQGLSSQFSSLTASVGGGIGSRTGNTGDTVGGSGGSGGGGGSSASSIILGGSPTLGQGYAGGKNSPNSTNPAPYTSGGGGGAGAVGGDGNGATLSGNGGIGSIAYSSWSTATGTGSSGYYAGGGGGGQFATGGTVGTGGLGGGGNGTGAGAGIAALTNTGSGGGGGGSSFNGGNGGSGIVIVRYPK